MKRMSIILCFFITLTTYCQDVKYNGVSHSTSKMAVMHNDNSLMYSLSIKGIRNVFNAGTSSLLINDNQTGKSASQPHKTKAVKFNMDYRILPLFSGKFSVLKNKTFPYFEPFLSVFLNRNTMYSNILLLNTELSRPFNLGVSFGAGLRLPISQRILFDIGLKDEIGVINNRQLHLKEIFSKDSPTLGLTFGLNYKI